MAQHLHPYNPHNLSCRQEYNINQAGSSEERAMRKVSRQYYLMKKLFLIILISVPGILLSGCSLLDRARQSLSEADNSVLAASYPSATPTPFMPVAEQATQEPEDAQNSIIPDAAGTSIPQDPWGTFAAPSEVSAIEIPPPMPEVALSDTAVTFVLLGSDQRADGYGYRTDSMMIVVVDPAEDSVVMLSVPRDLYVYIPGWRMERINAADAHGGEEGLEQTILYNFGIPVDYWVRINFYGFVSAIDSLGGIDVDVTGYLNDEYGGVWYNYGPGTYHMNGVQALGYVRMRKASSDFDRLRRQQEIVKAIFKKVVSLDGLSRLPDLYEQFNVFYQTNLNVLEMLPFVPTASRVASGAIALTGQTLTPEHVSSWTVPTNGAAVLLPQRDVMIALIEDMFAPPVP